MLYLRLRQRDFRVVSGPAPSGPVLVQVTFELIPPWPFGTKSGSGLSRTAWYQRSEGKPTTVGQLHANRHRGILWSEPVCDVRPLQVEARRRGITFELTGTTMVMKLEATSLEQLDSEIARFYYWFPIFLNLDFGDPPAITSVTVQTSEGGVAVWVPKMAWNTVFPTDQERQAEHVQNALAKLLDVQGALEPKVLAALEYFYVASRLVTLGETPGEFLAEAILNYAKILEVLFSAKGMPSADAARSGLACLGFESDEIEWNYIPAIYLRNSLGIGHPALSNLSAEELEVVHEFSDQAEGSFRRLLKLILDLPDEKREFLRREADQQSSKALKTMIRKMRMHFANRATETKTVTITNPPPPIKPKSKY